MNAVSARDVSKKFKIFKERNQTLKHTILRRKRSVYEEFWALERVSFDVEAGVIYGLIGENGSGKSTLLKCIARILEPDQGQIVTDGSVSALLELGAGFHPELSGRENVYLNGAILGLNRRELRKKFDEIVAFSGIERFIDTPVKNYSSGMYVRLGFSVAINVEPEILLVDEVLSVGDEEFQQKCRDKFSELHARGTTVIIVSHSMDLVQDLCSRAAWLEHGRMKVEGRADEVISSYIASVHPETLREETTSEEEMGSIDSVELVSPGGQTDVLNTGESVRLKMTYALARELPRAEFRAWLLTPEGVEIASISSKEEIHLAQGQAEAELEIPSFPLITGTYLAIVELGTKTEEAAIRAEKPFSVRTKPGYGRGLVPLEATWKFAHTQRLTSPQ